MFAMQLLALAHHLTTRCVVPPQRFVGAIFWLGMLTGVGHSSIHAAPSDRAAPIKAQQVAPAPAPMPALQTPVTDLANVLDPAQRVRLEYKLADLRAQRGVSPAVLIVQDTGADPIARYAARVLAGAARSSVESQDNALLLMVSVGVRRMRVAVGTGLDGRVPDALAERISDEQAKTLLQEEDYFGGIDAAIDALALQLGGALAIRPEVAGTPAAFVRSALSESDPESNATQFTPYHLAGFGLLLLGLLGYTGYRWHTMRLCTAGFAALVGSLAVTHLFGSDALVFGVTGVVATVIGALVLAVSFRGMRRTLQRGDLRDFGLRWLAVAGLTAAMAWQAKGNWIPVVITALLAMLFAFMPTGERRTPLSDNRDDGDLPEGW